jgi:hypothetical protein
MTRRRALAALAAIGVLAVGLIVVELVQGAVDAGSSESKNACTATTDFHGGGLDGTIQRIALDGLYGAACELGTTREQLVLSFAPDAKAGADVHWSRKKAERALRAGLERAIDSAEERGSLPGFLASVVRELVERAPLDFLLRGTR